MNTRILSLVFLVELSVVTARSQTTNVSDPKPRSRTVEDFKPATTNQRDSGYQQINSEGRGRARIVAPAARNRGPGGVDFGAFEKVLLEDVIPFVDANFRTIADQPHRPMAGLSTGGMQTQRITLAHMDTFSHIGIFSGGAISTNDISDLAAFKQKIKLVFVSYGSRELRGGGSRGPFGGDPKPNAEALENAGINCQFYVSPQTAHESQRWRRSLHEFAPLLFRD